MATERVGPIDPESGPGKLLLRAMDHPVEVTIEEKTFRIQRVFENGLPYVDPEKQLAALRALAGVLEDSPTFNADDLNAEIRADRHGVDEDQGDDR